MELNSPYQPPNLNHLLETTLILIQGWSMPTYSMIGATASEQGPVLQSFTIGSHTIRWHSLTNKPQAQ